MLNGPISLEMAETKLISAISSLIWIIPGLTVLEVIISIYLNQPIEWKTFAFYDIYLWILLFVLISKMITIIDKQITLERKYREKKAKEN